MQILTRMRIIRTLSPVMLLALLASCDEIVDPSDAPYVERLVVRGVLSPGDTSVDIQISRTIPVTEPYFVSDRYPDDVRAEIVVDGETYPLVYREPGPGMAPVYHAPGLIPASGKEYRLIAEWNGKTATASTTVPYPVTIEDVDTRISSDTSGSSVTWYFRVVGRFRPIGDQVYSGGIVLTDSTGRSLLNLECDPLLSIDETHGGGHIEYYCSTGYGGSRFDTNGKVTAILFSFDQQYDAFRRTFTRHRFDMAGIENVGAEQVTWNVKGDAIGMFIGRAETRVDFR